MSSDCAPSRPATVLHTLAAPASHAIEVRHSRFVARAVALDSEAAALQALQQLGDADASHRCWAYRVGSAYRSSDDGEPAGTAGRPILAAIHGQGFDRVVVLVMRWFGGIKLGAGGLVRAYGGCAAECLRGAERRPLLPMSTLTIHAGFDDLGHLHAALALFEADKRDEHFHATGATLTLHLRRDRVAALSEHLRNVSRDRIRILIHPADACAPS